MASAVAGAGEIRLADVFASLSLASDLGSGFPLEKALRNSLLATRLAAAAGLGPRLVHDAYFVAMLRYIGCTGLDYEMGSSFGDAAAARALFAALDTGRPGQAVPRVLAHLGEGEGPARRAAIVARFMSSGKRGGERLLAADCEVVARFSVRLRLGEGVAVPLGQMFERWDGKGAPAGLSGDAIEPAARVVHVAHAAEIHHRLGGADEACRFLQAGSGGWFDPALVAVFAGHAGELLSALGPGSVWDAALAAEPAPHRTVERWMVPAPRAAYRTGMSSDAYNYQRFAWDLESGADERWLTEAPALGTEAPDFELPDLEGRHHRLRDFRGHPAVIEFGSYTCPIFCGHLPAMEDVAREHPDTAFLVIYTREAHPGEVTPAHATQAAKHRAAVQLVSEEAIGRVLLVDDLDGTVHRRYGGGWDSVFVLDAQGRVVLRRAWNDPGQVRVTLDALAGRTVQPSESAEMAPPASRAGFGHGLLRGGASAVLDFYASAPPPVRQQLETSASEAVRALVTAPGAAAPAGAARPGT